MYDFSWYANKTVLVTGSTGMIGREVVRLLCDAGAFVRGASLDDLLTDTRAFTIKGDLRNPVFCELLMPGVDVVLHVAGIKASAQITRTRPASFFVPLLQLNTSVLAAARAAEVEHVVYVSSIGAYNRSEYKLHEDDTQGEPQDGYPGRAKLIGEWQVQAYRTEYRVKWAVVRPAAVYGPGDDFNPETAMVIPALLGKVLRGDDPVEVLGTGREVRDFVYATDVAEGILLAGIKAPLGIVNLGSAAPCSIRHLVGRLEETTGANFKTPVFDGFVRNIKLMDIERAEECLGWRPKITLKTGLQMTWAWLQGHPQEQKGRVNWFT